MYRRGETGPLARGHRALGLLLALVALPAYAQTGPITNQSLFFDQASNAHRGNYLEAEGGLVYTDNVDLTRGGPGDTLAMLGLLGATSGDRPHFDYRLASDIALVKYLHSSFQTQPFGYADGSAELRIAPGFFSWTGRESYSQAVIDPFRPVTPDNLESLNYVTTGPRFTLRPTLRTTITVDGTYSYVNSSSKSPLYVNIDDHRYAGDITLSRAFTNTASVYITGSSNKVEFTDQVANTNFRQDQALAGLKFTNARTVLDLAGGYTKLHEFGLATVQTLRGPRQLPQNQTPSGATWHVQLSRLISPTQRVSLRAVKQVTDAANLFRLNVDQPVPTTVPNRIVSGQPFTDREFGATWRLQAQRTSLQIDVLDLSQRYRARPASNSDFKDVSALFARQLSPVLNWDIGVAYEHAHYGVGGSVDTVNAITSLRWKLGERVGLRFIYAHSTLTPHGYADNQVGVTASYALTAAGQAGSQAPAAPALQPTSPMSAQPHLQ
jgi:hypothetical protein